jgi:hypothetical protein
LDFEPSRIVVRLTRFSRRTWLSGLAATALAGCTALERRLAVLPERNSRTLDQLVIHSDWELPSQHRLLDDLRLLRSDVLQTLALPPSDEPIHIYLFETEKALDEYLAKRHPGLPSRRAFFVKSDTRLAIFAFWGDRVAEDLRHETTHGYLHSVVPNLPLWLDEGLAEYFEVPRSSGGLNVPHAQQLLTLLMTRGWRPGIPRLESLTTLDRMTQEDYAESWAWVRWMLDTDPELRQLLQNYLTSLRGQAVFVPLSVVVKAHRPEAERQLCDYLYSLSFART